jgi:hypothetical protein
MCCAGEVVCALIAFSPSFEVSWQQSMYCHQFCFEVGDVVPSLGPGVCLLLSNMAVNVLQLDRPPCTRPLRDEPNYPSELGGVSVLTPS